MKNLVVRIFLASSIELQEDRVLFGDLIRRLDNMYEKQCIRIYLFKWEDFDAAYNNKVKQKEYDEEIRKCDVFVALFKNKAGAKTLEEFEEALSLLKSTEKPKIFVYCKNTKEKDEEKELKEFKKELSDKIGHYWETYDNADTLRFKFLYQLQLMITGLTTGFELNNGVLTVMGSRIADINALSFASCNQRYKETKKALEVVAKKIQRKEVELENAGKEKLSDKSLQKMKQQKNELEEDLEMQQKYMLDTAMTVFRMQQEMVSEKLHNAILAFEKGNLETAEFLLKEILADSKSHSEQAQIVLSLLYNDIEALMVRAKVVMNKSEIPIDNRWKEARNYYQEAVQLADRFHYDTKKYAVLLRDYAEHLKGRESIEAMEVFKRQIEILEREYGVKNKYVARVYQDLVELLLEAEGKDKRLLADQFLDTAMTIQYGLGNENLELVKTYYLKGRLLRKLDRFDEVEQYLKKAETIAKKVLPSSHKYAAELQSEFGLYYKQYGEKMKEGDLRREATIRKAIECYENALRIKKRIYVEDHEKILLEYNNMANAYRALKDYDKAIELQKMIIEIKENKLGVYHLSTVRSYNNLGRVYYYKGDCGEALKLYEKALKIKEGTLSKTNDNQFSISKTYYNMGLCYAKMGDENNANKCFRQALNIREQLGMEDAVEEVRNAISKLESC